MSSQAEHPIARRLAWLHVAAVVVGVIGLLAVLGWTMHGAIGPEEVTSSEGVVSGVRPQAVVLVAIEGVSPEILEQLALKSHRMPTLANLARESAWFDRHWAQSNSTNGAFGCLLTGLYSSHSGLGSPVRVGREGLSSATTLISEDLQGAGYQCLASVGSHLLSSDISGFDQGWDRFADSRFGEPVKHRNAEEVVDAIAEDLDRALGGPDPVFALFEFRDPRRPFTAPRRFECAALVEHLMLFEDEYPEITPHLETARSGRGGGEQLRKLLGRRRGTPVQAAMETALEQAELQFVDEQLGRVIAMLKKSGRYEDSLLIVTGNLGPGRRKTTSAGSAFAPFSLERQRVPLLIRFPGGARTRAVHALTRAIDVRATITAVLGLDSHDSDGVSLLPLVTDSGSPGTLHDCVLFEDGDLGTVGAVDEFWFVRNGADGVQVALDEARRNLPNEDVAPVLKATLKRTRAALREFDSEPQVRVELAPGSSREFEVELTPLPHGKWLEAIAVGGRTRRSTGGESLSATAGGGPSEALLARPESNVRFLVASVPDGAERAGAQVWCERDGPGVLVSIRSADRALDESKIRIGQRALSRIAVLRTVRGKRVDWPAASNGGPGDGDPVQPTVDIVRGEGRWRTVRIGGEPGKKVELLLVGSPLETGRDSKLLVEPSGLEEVLPVPGRLDAFWVHGETPMSISMKCDQNDAPGISVALEGVQVPVSEMRYLGHHFSEPGTLSLAILEWLPGVHELVSGPRNPGQRTFDPGTLWIGTSSRRRYPNDRSALDRVTFDKLLTLESHD